MISKLKSTLASWVGSWCEELSHCLAISRILPIFMTKGNQPFLSRNQSTLYVLHIAIWWNSKFKMKSIYTNQEKIQLVQIGTKMMHEQVMSNPTHKAHHNLNSRGAHHFPSYSIFCDWQIDKKSQGGILKNS